jgi:tetratricopeptide (TPR) repeat protein
MNADELIKKAYESILGQDFEQAIAWFEQAIGLEPDNAAYHYKLSITYARSNRIGRAIEHAQRAFHHEPDNEIFAANLLNLKSKQLIVQAEKFFTKDAKELYSAIEILKQAIHFDPLSTEAYLLVSLAYARLHHFKEAIFAVEEVLKLDPNHEAANKLLKDYHSRKEQVDWKWVKL